jgi:hypothetical protein
MIAGFIALSTPFHKYVGVLGMRPLARTVSRFRLEMAEFLANSDERETETGNLERAKAAANCRTPQKALCLIIVLMQGGAEPTLRL